MWLLGDHRLLWGDGTKRGDLERVLGGSSSNMIFTDLPFNVNYISETFDHCERQSRRSVRDLPCSRLPGHAARQLRVPSDRAAMAKLFEPDSAARSRRPDVCRSQRATSPSRSHRTGESRMNPLGRPF